MAPNTKGFGDIIQNRNGLAEQSNSVAAQSPFKKDSTFYVPPPLTEEDFKNATFKEIYNDWDFLLKSIKDNGVGNPFLLKYKDYDTSNSTTNYNEPNI